MTMLKSTEITEPDLICFVKKAAMHGDLRINYK